MYAPEAIPLRPNVDPDRPLRDQEHWFNIYRWDFRYYSFHLPYTEEMPEDFSLRHVIALYCGLTTWVDDTVGRMLGALEDAGLAENTVVIFTSDHGDNLGSHGLVQKGGPNEESIRVPLILRWPVIGRRGMTVRSRLASLVDLAPTLLSLAGLPVPGHVHGRDLAPLLRGERDAAAEPHAFFETGGGAGIRTVSHMYFLPFAGPDRLLADRPAQFYDLTADPYQMRNLAEAEPLPEIAAELDSLLRAWDRATPWMAAG
jgi:choline-sulfatase